MCCSPFGKCKWKDKIGRSWHYSGDLLDSEPWPGYKAFLESYLLILKWGKIKESKKLDWINILVVLFSLSLLLLNYPKNLPWIVAPLTCQESTCNLFSGLFLQVSLCQWQLSVWRYHSLCPCWSRHDHFCPQGLRKHKRSGKHLGIKSLMPSQGKALSLWAQKRQLDFFICHFCKHF